jgi:hypothetical protein
MKPLALTMRDVLHQGVADAVRLITHVTDEIVSLRKNGFTYIVADVAKGHYSQVASHHYNDALRISWSARCDAFERVHEETPLVSAQFGGYSNNMGITTAVATHRAVQNALEAMFGALCTPTIGGETPYMFSHTAPLIIRDEFEPMTWMLPRAKPINYNITPVIPQLGIAIGDLKDVPPYWSGDPDVVRLDLDSPLWMTREQGRFSWGEYGHLPEDVLDLIPMGIRESQFPHCPTKDGNTGMIAFTQSPTAGALDRQQTMKAGRYIRQNCPDLNDEQVKQAAAAYLSSFSAGIHHTRDEHEVARVYQQGPNSCMSHHDRFEPLRVNGEYFHPTQVYMHEDNALELIYMEINDRIGARVLVNKANMEYPRVYGSDSIKGGEGRLTRYIESLGYTQTDDALVGQKLRNVSPDCDSEAIICPFIDNGNQGVEVFNNYLLVGGNEEANYENGCLQSYGIKPEADWHCDDCGDGMDYDDEQNRTVDDQSVCNSCLSCYVYAFSVEHGDPVYVQDNSDNLYGVYDSHTYRRHRYVHVDLDDHHDLVLLNANIYGGNMVTDSDNAVEHHDYDFVCGDELADHDLFLNGDDNIAYPISEWCVVDGELTELRDRPELYELSDDEDSDYPQLRNYITVESDEEAA